jgi:hypothetical protein
MSDDDDLDSIRVVSKSIAIKAAGVSSRTWDRLEAIGDTPPLTRLSSNRFGYRIVDLRAWLDRRRIRREDDHDRRMRLIKRLRATDASTA